MFTYVYVWLVFVEWSCSRSVMPTPLHSNECRSNIIGIHSAFSSTPRSTRLVPAGVVAL
jgi:hypothetical protein